MNSRAARQLSCASSFGAELVIRPCFLCPEWSRFTKARPFRIVTGFGAGDVDDQWPRLIGPIMTKYIPGNPNVIVQNMAGAGSMVAANYVYGVAKPDGLT